MIMKANKDKKIGLNGWRLLDPDDELLKKTYESMII